MEGEEVCFPFAMAINDYFDAILLTWRWVLVCVCVYVLLRCNQNRKMLQSAMNTSVVTIVTSYKLVIVYSLSY